MASVRDGAGWELFGFWAGSFAGQLGGVLAVAPSVGGSRDNAFVMPLASVAGGVIGTVFAHGVARLAKRDGTSKPAGYRPSFSFTF